MKNAPPWNGGARASKKFTHSCPTAIAPARQPLPGSHRRSLSINDTQAAAVAVARASSVSEA
jgi:hypothetical protein